MASFSDVFILTMYHHFKLSKSYLSSIKKDLEKHSVQNHDDLIIWLKDNFQGEKETVEKLMPPENIRKIKGYLVCFHLASGGMGDVWFALDSAKEIVVIKTIRAAQDADEISIKRFERESRITTQLNSDYVVKCLDFDKVDDTYFMVLEYVSGGDISEFTKKHGGMSELDALKVIYHLALGLEEAYGQNLIHRDIKPANIFVCKDLVAKLADFGLARSVDDSRSFLTEQGASVGTLCFMAPEQLLDPDNVDVRCDIYALGATLYTILLAEKPYKEYKTMQSIMNAMMEKDFPDIKTKDAMIADDIANLVSLCTKKNREERPENPMILASLLEELILLRKGVPKAPLGDNFKTPSFFELINQKSDPNLKTIIMEPSPESNPTFHVPLISRDQENNGETKTTTLPPCGNTETLDLGDSCKSEKDLPNSVSDSWITIEIQTDKGKASISAFSQKELVFGKQTSKPVDISLVNYPPQEHLDDINRISRSHFSISTEDKKILIKDLDSTNGIKINGNSKKENELTINSVCNLTVADVIDLFVQVIPRASSEENIGAVVIKRTTNRKDLTYLLLSDEITLSGDNANCIIEELGRHKFALKNNEGKWYIRFDSESKWEPIIYNNCINDKGFLLTIKKGDYPIYY